MSAVVSEIAFLIGGGVGLGGTYWRASYQGQYCRQGTGLIYLAFPTLVDIVAGDVLLLLLELCVEVGLELAGMV